MTPRQSGGDHDGSSGDEGDGRSNPRSLKPETNGSATASSAMAGSEGEDVGALEGQDASSSAGVEEAMTGADEKPKGGRSFLFDSDSSSDSQAELDEEAEQEKAKKRKAAVAQHSGVDARRVNRDKVGQQVYPCADS